MIEVLDRLKSGIYFDPLLKPYSKDFLMKFILLLIEEEMYEECTFVEELIFKLFKNKSERYQKKIL
jgi:hypothetical protein